MEIPLEGINIKGFDCILIIEICAHWVGFVVMLVQNVQIEGFWPPLHVCRHAARGQGTVHYWTFAAGVRDVVMH